MMDNVSIKEEIDDFDSMYIQYDPYHIYCGITRNIGIEFIRPTASMKLITLGINKWVKIIKLPQPLGLSSEEFRNLPSSDEYKMWDCVMSGYKNRFRSAYFTIGNGIPLPIQRIMKLCQDLNPELIHDVCHFQSFSTLRSYNWKCIKQFCKIDEKDSNACDRYRIYLGPIKAKMIFKDENLQFKENGQWISGNEYHVQIEYNTLVITIENLNYLQYSVYNYDDEELPILVSFPSHERIVD